MSITERPNFSTPKINIICDHVCNSVKGFIPSVLHLSLLTDWNKKLLHLD